MARDAANDIDAGGWLIRPQTLRALAVVVGLVGLALPAVVARWVTETTPPPEGLGVGPLRPEMVVIRAGEYTIGSPETEAGRSSNEPQHRVTLNRPFAIAITEVTQEQYQRVMGDNPSEDKSCGWDCPVTGVSWLDAVAYLNALSALDDIVEPCYRIDGEEVEWIAGCTGYRLPTEAEWEVAARAESDGRYAGTDDPAEICNYGNVADAAFKVANPDREFDVLECKDGFAALAPVASFDPNGFRLHDMTGNVWEWIWDWYGSYQDGAVDPRGPPGGRARVARGGSFVGDPRLARVAGRYVVEPSLRRSYLGFRVARSLP